MRRYLAVVTGRNCSDRVEACLRSLADQRESFLVCVVDDASEDGTAGIVKHYAREYGWLDIVNQQRRYALANQVAAWRALDPGDEDVVVFVDMDDQLARDDVAEVLDRYYDAGAWMTYGSYAPVPADHPDAAGCRAAQAYPPHVTAARGYRDHRPFFNHLRTISWRVLKNLTESDLRDRSGRYWKANTDASVMVPCLEMAGHRCAVIPETLYLYSCDNPAAVWRTDMQQLQREWADLRSRPRKPVLKGAA